MRRWLKRSLWSLGWLLLIVLFLLAGSYYWLRSQDAASTVEHYLSDYLQTPVKITGRLEIKPWADLQVSVKAIDIHNPLQPAQTLLSLQQVDIVLDAQAFLANQIVLRSLHFASVEVHLSDAADQTDFTAVSALLRQLTVARTTPADPEQVQLMQIDQLMIERLVLHTGGKRNLEFADLKVTGNTLFDYQFQSALEYRTVSHLISAELNGRITHQADSGDWLLKSLQLNFSQPLIARADATLHWFASAQALDAQLALSRGDQDHLAVSGIVNTALWSSEGLDVSLAIADINPYRSFWPEEISGAFIHSLNTDFTLMGDIWDSRFLITSLQVNQSSLAGQVRWCNKLTHQALELQLTAAELSSAAMQEWMDLIQQLKPNPDTPSALSVSGSIEIEKARYSEYDLTGIVINLQGNGCESRENDR